MRMRRSSKRPNFTELKYTSQSPSPSSSKRTCWRSSTCRDIDPRALPADASVGADVANLVVTLGIRSSGSLRGSVRGDGMYIDAGVSCPIASCGRSSLYLARNRLKRTCWADRLPAGGRVASAFSVRCIRCAVRSVLGATGSMSSGRMPRRIHHTDRWDRRPIAVVAKGAPLSLRMMEGKPYSRNSRAKYWLR